MPQAYTWDEATGHYRDAQGKPVSERDIRRVIDDMIAGTIGALILSLSKRLLQGEISVGEWQAEMMAAIKDTQLVAVMAAQGGLEAMLPEDYVQAQAYVGSQYKWLQILSKQVTTGTQPMNGFFPIRAGMYIEAARQAYENVRLQGMKDRGITEAKRVLGASSHSCPDCIELADEWVPIEDLTPIGDTQCGVNCNCEIEYRGGQGGE